MSTRRLSVLSQIRPAYVVWELTLRCDQPCTHCGSRAGEPRESELSEAEALAVVPQLSALGCDEVVLIGGEAYLHPGFVAIIQALAAANIRPTMTTGGRGITAALATQMAQAGMASVSVERSGPMIFCGLCAAALMQHARRSDICAVRGL
jgi:MoaA/NifB/PqqE/SkfB family radical SAM enzyme